MKHQLTSFGTNKKTKLYTIKKQLCLSYSCGSEYGLTNYTAMGAPMASALVSATFGVGKLVYDYKKSHINDDELIANGMMICLESGMVALGAVVG